MGSNIIELAKLGHERAAELKASCGAVDVRSLAQLISDLATQLEVQLVRGNAQTEQLANAESKCRELAAENAGLKQIIDSVTDLSNEPQYHAEGMGCGLEDRGITDRYEAMRHGWDEAMERIYGEVIPCAEEIAFPATDAFLAEVRAQGVENVGEYLKQYAQGLHEEARLVLQDAGELCNGFAAQLRKGAAL
ncbi:hypothetical protein ACLBR3_004381 [Salmonella enterica]